MFYVQRVFLERYGYRWAVTLNGEIVCHFKYILDAAKFAWVENTPERKAA